MRRTHILVALLGLLIFGGWLAHYLHEERGPTTLACSSDRVVSFGWTHRERALAEMAAILRWQTDASRQGPRFGAWHLAQKRSLQCRPIGGPGGHFQCRISATPCRRPDGGEPALSPAPTRQVSADLRRAHGL